MATLNDPIVGHCIHHIHTSHKLHERTSIHVLFWITIHSLEQHMMLRLFSHVRIMLEAVVGCMKFLCYATIIQQQWLTWIGSKWWISKQFMTLSKGHKLWLPCYLLSSFTVSFSMTSRKCCQTLLDKITTFILVSFLFTWNDASIWILLVFADA